LLVHPTKVQILEAMRWIAQPLAASELAEVFDGELNLPGISYHMTSLANFGVLREVEKYQVRGVWKRRYVFTSAARR